MKADRKLDKQVHFVSICINKKVSDDVKLLADWYNSEKNAGKIENNVLVERFVRWMQS